MKVEETKAFGKLSGIAQTIAKKSASRKQILEAVVIVNNIGYEKWISITSLPTLWHSIVKELTA